MNKFFTHHQRSIHRGCLASIVGVVSFTSWGCHAPDRSDTSSIPRPPHRGSTIMASPEQTPTTNLLIVDGLGIGWSAMLPALEELAGAQAVEDVVLDAAIDARVSQQGLVVTPTQVEAERERLLAAIAGESGLSQSQADQALARIREARGLGPVRFSQLLKRNAGLRALVAGTFDPTPEERVKELEVATGAKVTGVLVLVADEKEASLIRAGFLEPPGPSIERLAAIARARSLDTSARVGGRVGPIHPGDPRVPGALRHIFQSLPLGEVSPVVSTDEGFAILMIESRSEPLVRTPEVEASVEAALLARKERLAMERLARQLIAEAKVRVMDESLRWSWERRRGDPVP
jgi:parvulin-like peptidyl-prolyl isomerase